MEGSATVANEFADTLVLEPPRNRVGFVVRIRTLGAVRLQALALTGALLALELVARRDLYGLRVTGDSPSYVGLLYQLARHPFTPVNAYFPGIESSHATPDLQLTALVWRASHGTAAVDPVAAYRLLALAGIVSTGLLLHAMFLWVRRHAGSRAAWISIPVLLGLFGPAHVIWAGDVSLHGLLYGSFYSQTLGLALALYTLAAVARHGTRSALLTAVPLLAATMAVHPFTGLLLAVFISLRGCLLALRRGSGWWTAAPVIAGGYGLGSLWPCYGLGGAFAAGGANGTALVGLLAALPLVVGALPARLRSFPLRTDVFLPNRVPRRTITGTAIAGLLGVVGLIGWEAAMIWGPEGASWSRLDVYWIDHLGRWPLLLATGLPGLIGLLVLARRGKPLPLIWLASFYLIGVTGALGVAIPLWYRFILLCQPPLALGVAAIAADRNHRLAGRLIAAAVTLSLAFSVYTLIGLSPQTTYLGGGWIPDGFLLDKAIPPGHGGVISDPSTSYYIPAATGRPVLTVTASHVGSPGELAAAERGYKQLESLYSQRGSRWWATMRTLWSEGFRYVVVAHVLSIRPLTLREFSAAPPQLRSEADRRQLGRYFWALNRVATLVADTRTYAVYRLDQDRVW